MLAGVMTTIPPNSNIHMQRAQRLLSAMKRRGSLALMLNRSSRVMPGLRGMPAGITTSAQPYSASGSFSGPVKLVTWASVCTDAQREDALTQHH